MKVCGPFFAGILITGLALLSHVPLAMAADEVWKHHTIDDSSRGADGVRAMDVNGDGLLDLVTAWEQGGKVRAYLNPGKAKAKEKWPAVTVGTVKSGEDAVFVDLDSDGAVDVVSCCEANIKSVYVHWAPTDKADYLTASKWQTEAFPAMKGHSMWMFCLPMQIDGKHGVDLVIGGKGKGAQIGWLEAPAKPRDLAAWRFHPLRDAGWTMSLVAADVDGDGKQDILLSDRRGKTAGCSWLQNPGPGNAQTMPWKEHAIGPRAKEPMFLDWTDLDGDGLRDVLVSTLHKELWWHRRTAGNAVAWETLALPFPATCGTGKGVRVADIDGDGRPDIVLSTGNGEPCQGLVWMSYRKVPASREWDVHPISPQSAPNGFKPDLIELIDLDGDGDLDVITTEERSNLGVIWYENPSKR